ncbi:hypothetical protein EDC60_3077 [Diaphorobacter nitroreducens]|uniref:Uncharacterized protein n=1 Tax=Diaphorobacter nitroreducens TaxID=164759 RepID=A0AAX1WQ31_9BURK|nr:hypothetical protein EDC60_3077 [Diaphorobacter nitroreducens]
MPNGILERMQIHMTQAASSFLQEAQRLEAFTRIALGLGAKTQGDACILVRQSEISFEGGFTGAHCCALLAQEIGQQQAAGD